MSVTNLVVSQTYTGNGSTTSFAIPFAYFTSSQVAVTIYDTVAKTTTALVNGVGFTISGANVITTATYGATITITVARVTAFQQTFDFINNTTVNQETIEQALDYLLMMSQEVNAKKVIELPKEFTGVFSPVLPHDIATANVCLIVNPTGTGFVKGPTAGEIANAQQYALDALASKVAAQNAQAAAETARAGAELAETNAETAQAAAEAAQLAAETAETNAETAETNAETAQAAAEAAQLAAETAQTAAELAETNAETAETNAETAQGLAEAARDAALAAQTAAENAQVAAELAETNAETAETNAETAQAAAEDAQAECEAIAASLGALGIGVGASGTVVPGAYPYTTTIANDGTVLLVDTTSARTINLHAPSPVNFKFTIKDISGQSLVNNITVVPNGAQKIDGVAANYTCNSNYGAWTFIFDGTDWVVIAEARDLETDVLQWNLSGTPTVGDNYPWQMIESKHNITKITATTKTNSQTTSSIFNIEKCPDNSKFYLNATGSLIPNIASLSSGKMEKQSDGKILMYGETYHYGNKIDRNRLLRFNSDGTLDTTFCTNAVDGGKFNNIIYSASLQSDGKILVGGDFTNYAGTLNRNRLVRLNSDGTLDTAFCTNASDGNKFTSTIEVVKVQSDGKILVGGGYTNYPGGTNRSRLIRLNSDGTTDATFCTNASDGSKFNNFITAIEIQSDGKILVGGGFTAYAGTTNRNNLIRLNSDGTLDTAFCTNAVDGAKFNNTTRTIEIQSDGKILVGGDFTDYAGTLNRNRLVRLNSDGTLDTTFCTNAVDGVKFNNRIRAIKIQSDGKILVGGSFYDYDGTTNRNSLIRLNSDGTLDTAFCTNAVDGVSAGKIQSLNSIYIDNSIIYLFLESNIHVGFYANYPYLQAGVITLNTDGSFNDICKNYFKRSIMQPAFGSFTISDFEYQSNNKILISGNFVDYGGVVGRNKLICLNFDGTIDTAFCTNAVDGAKFNQLIHVMRIQSDGKILVGGNFTDYAGTLNRNKLIRLNSDGTLDTAFCTNASDSGKFNSNIYFIGVQSDGKILVGGDFTNYAGTLNRNKLIRLNSDGTLDTAFCTNAVDGAKFNNRVSVIKVQSDGKILVGGYFTNYILGSRNRFVRLNSDGTIDTAFCANASDSNKFSNYGVLAINTQSDGKILAGGDFVNYGATANRNSLLRLNSDGTLDTTFCTNAVDGGKLSTVYNISIQSDGKSLLSLSGNFSSGPQTYNLARLNSDGTYDTVFNANICKFFTGYQTNYRSYRTYCIPNSNIILLDALGAYSFLKIGYNGSFTEKQFFPCSSITIDALFSTGINTTKVIGIDAETIYRVSPVTIGSGIQNVSIHMTYEK